tara:strand:- start:77 stop:343 length:267 start_codon:yes stop_codon:yes gene_type:complete
MPKINKVKKSTNSESIFSTAKRVGSRVDGFIRDVQDIMQYKTQARAGELPVQGPYPKGKQPENHPPSLGLPTKEKYKKAVNAKKKDKK